MTMTASRARSNTRGEQVRYECRVVRSLAPSQPELHRALGLLAANTANYVNYDLGHAGVTIIMLEPILRQILMKNRRGIIPKENLRHFEDELTSNLKHAQYDNYDIPLDPVRPLWLYGKNQNRLGLQFARRDYRLVGDRAVVEEYIHDTYDKPDGSPVSQRFIDKNSRRLKPHATIGEVLYENMTPAQAWVFQADPAFFLVQEAYHQMRRNQEEYGSTYQIEDIIFPETVGLNGLRVFCQQRQ
jgi:hypothetical protein